MLLRRLLLLTAVGATAGIALVAMQAPIPAEATVRDRYSKHEYAVAARDGVHLHTAVYAPRTCVPGGYPVMLQRTPYGVEPYGDDAYRRSLGPSPLFERDGFIFVYQDVRGRYQSEGIWEEVRPYVPPGQRRQGETNEATDTYDTIEWLLRNLPCNNGRVGMWGISYPGFYVSSGMIEAHPALRAVSPQAPVTDYYLGDDSFHNGAFMLAHNFSFYVEFPPRGPHPVLPTREQSFDYGTSDGYQFYLKLGSLREGTARHHLSDNPYWTMNLKHTSYDAFWKARSLWRHFQDVRPAVLTVGGWFDAENLMGALRTYRTLHEQSPSTSSRLVMGPWTHGSWARGDGIRVGPLDVEQSTASFYREQVEFPFFAARLKDRPLGKVPDVLVFDTGASRWRELDAWPPRTVTERTVYLDRGGTLAFDTPKTPGVDEYVSDPSQPVPLVGQAAQGMPRDYMTADQRFAATRPDVLVYQSDPLTADLTAMGPISVDLHVATSATDSDFVVKVIDVQPPGSADAGFQQLVRGEPFRGKFRQGFETPVPFVPGEPARIAFQLPDVAHTFRRGHRIMVHVQSSWFPLVDRNPQTFTHIPDARPDQFVRATQRVYHGGDRASSITLLVGS